MIDPKLNEIPVEELEKIPEHRLTAEQRQRLQQHRRAGYSITESIGGPSMLSVGSRGVDVSGTVAGAGAGQGMTNVTPGDSGSPAPNIVPGAQSTGTTPRADYNSGQEPTVRLGSTTGGAINEEISRRAYRCWHERGCPVGSPEVDWARAEEELRLERSQTEPQLRRSASAGRSV